MNPEFSLKKMKDGSSLCLSTISLTDGFISARVLTREKRSKPSFIASSSNDSFCKEP
jgi:hypothetical protein